MIIRPATAGMIHQLGSYIVRCINVNILLVLIWNETISFLCHYAKLLELGKDKCEIFIQIPIKSSIFNLLRQEQLSSHWLFRLRKEKKPRTMVKQRRSEVLKWNAV